MIAILCHEEGFNRGNAFFGVGGLNVTIIRPGLCRSNPKCSPGKRAVRSRPLGSFAVHPSIAPLGKVGCQYRALQAIVEDAL